MAAVDGLTTNAFYHIKPPTPSKKWYFVVTFNVTTLFYEGHRNWPRCVYINKHNVQMIQGCKQRI